MNNYACLVNTEPVSIQPRKEKKVVTGIPSTVQDKSITLVHICDHVLTWGSKLNLILPAVIFSCKRIRNRNISLRSMHIAT